MRGGGQGASDVVAARFDAVANMVRSLGLAPGTEREVLAKLDAARGAGLAGNWRTSLNGLDALAADLQDRGLAPSLVDEVLVLRSMVVFEMLFGPIPEAGSVRFPAPIQVWTLDVFLADLAAESPQAAADACASVIFPLPTTAAPANAGGGGQEEPNEKEIEAQAKKAVVQLVKKIAEDVWNWITGGRGPPAQLGGGGVDPGQPTGQTGGGGGTGDGKKGGPKVKPGCDVDTAALADKVLGGGTITLDDVKGAIKGVSLDAEYTWVKEDFTATLKGSIDVTDPFGDRSWKAGLQLQLSGGSGGRGWGAGLGGTFDSDGGWGVQGGIELRF
ncbi:MAG: hypothetical protein A3K65_05765 [Euryarchaeota archaeon RBG_16_68_12]|nr:MAG: hypothetical protein A3K65_05765 [Euryarchaeota archaeon RBG_16_68_12]